MRFLIFILFYLSLSLNCFSQKVFKGQLISGITGKPVKNAFIEIEGKGFIGETDSLGYFKINIDTTQKTILSFSSTELGSFSLEGLNFSSSEVQLINFIPACEHDAEKDISEGQIKLICWAGITGEKLTAKDFKFEKKYSVTYFSYSCTGIILDCMNEYNKKIAVYLDKKYGTKWRLDVRKDVCAIR